MEATLTDGTAVEEVARVVNGRAIVKYGVTEAALADLRSRYAGATWDLTTTAGDKAARAARLELVTLRTALERKRKEFKTPALEFGRLIDSEAARITAEIEALELPIDRQIKADEQRRAEEKAARERAEAERKAKLQAGVAGVRGFVEQANAPGMTAERIRKGLDILRTMVFEEAHWQEYHAAVLQAHADAVAGVEAALAGAIEREAEAARLAQEREELERTKAALEAQRAEQIAQAQRIAEAQRRIEEEAQAKAAEQQRVIAAAAEEAERAAAEASRLEQERQWREREQWEAFERAEAQKLAQERAAAAEPAAPAVVAEEPATLSTGGISTRLGFTLSTDFIERTLGRPCRDRAKAARLWRESDWPVIKSALIEHVRRLP